MYTTNGGVLVVIGLNAFIYNAISVVIAAAAVVGLVTVFKVVGTCRILIQYQIISLQLNYCDD